MMQNIKRVLPALAFFVAVAALANPCDPGGPEPQDPPSKPTSSHPNCSESVETTVSCDQDCQALMGNLESKCMNCFRVKDATGSCIGVCGGNCTIGGPGGRSLPPADVIADPSTTGWWTHTPTYSLTVEVELPNSYADDIQTVVYPLEELHPSFVSYFEEGQPYCDFRAGNGAPGNAVVASMASWNPVVFVEETDQWYVKLNVDSTPANLDAVPDLVCRAGWNDSLGVDVVYELVIDLSAE